MLSFCYNSLNLSRYLCEDPVIDLKTQQAKDCDRKTKTVAGKSEWYCNLM